MATPTYAVKTADPNKQTLSDAVVTPTALITTGTHNAAAGELVRIGRDAGNVVTVLFPATPNEGDTIGVTMEQIEPGDPGGGVIFDSNGNALVNYGKRFVQMGHCFVIFRWNNAEGAWLILEQGAFDFNTDLAWLRLFDQLTSDATPVQLFSYATQANNSMYRCYMAVGLRDSVVGDAGLIEAYAVAKRSNTGVVSVTALTPPVTSTPGSLAGSLAAFSSSGANITALVTGVAATAIKWQAEMRITGLEEPP